MGWLSRAFGFEKQAESANADGTVSTRSCGAAMAS
jgi:hypothetical protein